MNYYYMKKRYLLLIYIALVTLITLIFLYPSFFFPGVNPLAVDLIIINIIIYLIRTPIIRIIAYIFRKRLIRIVITSLINITWGVFLLGLLFALSLETFIAVLSFLIIAVSLTFKKLINNITSGVLMLTTEQFEIGDLIDTNGVQGQVQEITLNQTKLKEFDGVNVVVPNSNIFGTMITKFTYKVQTLVDLKIEDDEEEDEGDRTDYKKYIEKAQQLFEEDKKITRYAKNVEITSDVEPEELDRLLNEVFDEYEPRFGVRPDYVVDMVTVSRCKIDLLITAETPTLVLQYLDAFLRDVLFKLHHDSIYNKWEEYKEKLEV
ncbi:MAG: putative MscS family protein YkuT [Promethearchaeota archaeon]|nr:MAG: putative MscS family protein YkuT [Candidatus Lokiarchaeota archaeon]